MSGNADNSTTSYEYDYEDETCNKTKVVQFGAIVTPLFFTVVVLFSLVGNVLVLWVLLRYEDLRSLTNAFLFNLAVSDLLFTAGLPFWASYHVTGGWTFGGPACKVVSFIFFVGFYSSAISITMMTVHRYMAVVHPLSVIWNRRTHHCVSIPVVIWILSFGAACPHAIFTRTTSQHLNNGSLLYCDYDDINWKLAGIYQQNCFFLVSFFIITFCYTQILRQLCRPTAHPRHKTVRLIFCIVVVFFIGWAPYNVTIFLDSLISWNVSPFNECPISTSIDYTFYVSRLVAFSHCCLNPVFYGFIGIKFRSHLKNMLRTICRNGDRSENRHSHLIYSNGEEFSMVHPNDVRYGDPRDRDLGRRKMAEDGNYILHDFSDDYSYEYLDYEDETCNQTKVVQFGAIVTPVFFTVVVLFSLVGNVLVLWVLLRYEDLRFLTNAFLFNLAVSDLLFTAGLPFWASYHVTGGWTFGGPACKVVSFIFFVGFYSSAISITMMTVHRYMAVVHPLSVIWNRRTYHCVSIPVVIWILSFGAASPHAIFTTATSQHLNNGSLLYCDYDDINWKLAGVYQQNCFFLVSFFIITFCYTQILRQLCRPTAHPRHKTARLIFCIVVVFFIGWAPYNVTIFLDSLIVWNFSSFNNCPISTSIDYTFYVSRLVAFSHCCLNPVFYVFMGSKFRSHLKSMLRTICRNKQSPDENKESSVF
ncbi:hypothetical protein NFI96_019294 [Prochilodus magdalenae]|nr:hypothetical protein NFI96_019294 [Prochilodus magdalenae]